MAVKAVVGQVTYKDRQPSPSSSPFVLTAPHLYSYSSVLLLLLPLKTNQVSPSPLTKVLRCQYAGEWILHTQHLAHRDVAASHQVTTWGQSKTGLILSSKLTFVSCSNNCHCLRKGRVVKILTDDLGNLQLVYLPG